MGLKGRSRLSWIPQRIKPHKFHGALRGIIGMRPYVRLSAAFYGRLDKRERFPRDFMLPPSPSPRLSHPTPAFRLPLIPGWLAGRAIPMDIRSRRYLHDCMPDGLRIVDERESIRLTSRRAFTTRSGAENAISWPRKLIWIWRCCNERSTSIL